MGTSDIIALLAQSKLLIVSTNVQRINRAAIPGDDRFEFYFHKPLWQRISGRIGKSLAVDLACTAKTSLCILTRKRRPDIRDVTSTETALSQIRFGSDQIEIASLSCRVPPELIIVV